MFEKRKQCYRTSDHGKHKWSITRMGETVWFRCPGRNSSTSYPYPYAW